MIHEERSDEGNKADGPFSTAHSSVFLIDASAFIFRAYYALAPLSSRGRPSHALAGFASMLLKLIREKKPQSCIVVFDSKIPSFRKDIFPEYKANRVTPPPDLSGQIEAAMALCQSAELPMLQGEGFEADDWIASFVHTFQRKYPIVIVSSDKDLMQLVSLQVLLYDSFRDRMMGEKEVEEKWNVPPRQVRDLLGLMGDSSDNIPGVPGIGPKTAAQILSQFGSLPKLLKDKNHLPEKWREKIILNEKQLSLSYELVGLKNDLEVPFKKIPELTLPWKKSFKDFLMEWDCTRLLKQYETDFESSSSMTTMGTAPAMSHCRLLQSQKDLEHLRSILKNKNHVVVDIETSSFNREVARLVGISLAWNGEEAWYIPLKHVDPAQPIQVTQKELDHFVREILSDSKISKIGHNLKYDYQILCREGFEIAGPFEDTMIMAHVLQSDRRSFSLENLAHEFLGEEKGDLKSLLKEGEDFSKIPLEVATRYAAQDAHLTWGLYEKLSGELKKIESLEWLYRTIEIPLVPILANMEEMGVFVDPQKLKKLSLDLHAKLEKIQTKIYQVAGKEFNIQSPKQLQVILFEDLGLKPVKKTKTGLSTDESVLQELVAAHELPRLILEHRTLSKLTSTYVDVLPTLVSERDGRIHTHYHQTGTATGRLSSSEPNLQNIPVKTEEGLKIREAFIPENGFQFFGADYSQIELRLFAHLADDENMIQAFRKGRDIHSETAKIIFGSDEPEFRSRSKAINFGIIYGISAFGLSKQLGIATSEAALFIESYFKEFAGLKRYMEATVEKARKKEFTETIFGRRRPLPDIHSKNPTLRQLAERVAINAPVQGTAADIMKWAMVKVAEVISSRKLKSRLLLQVHDELILEVAQGEEKTVEKLILDCMSNLSQTPAGSLKVPLVVHTAFGKSWAKI